MTFNHIDKSRKLLIATFFKINNVNNTMKIKADTSYLIP